MLAIFVKPQRAALLAFFFLTVCLSFSQSAGNSTVTGTVLDPTGAVIPNASIEIRNPVSGLQRTATTDNSGRFTFPNLPFNPYHLTVRTQGFAPYSQDIEVRA